jgi:succinyl-CoA synthetase beta subunit
MNIHEYQAKALLSRYNVATPVGYPAFSDADAKDAIAKLKGPVWVVKAQIHAGGRGLGGGVKLAKSPEEALDWYKKIMGMQLVTHQTGPEGKKVERVYIEDGSAIARELYLGMLIDRSTYRVTIIASTEGGMDIEHVAEKNPEKIMTLSIDPVTGLLPFHGRRVAFGLGLTGNAAKECVKFLEAMYRAFIDTDASMLEINPLVVTKDDTLVALDAKMNFDDNALFRHPDIFALRDETEEDPAEIEATAHSLNYVKLDGDIGCMVNGAGLAMATMDIIKLYGSSPANFLDVGGGATKERVTAAFKIILRDPNVKAILVNIFGGIMRCDIIAEGVIAAAREINLHVPLVVRLEGTNVDLGKKIMAESGLPIISADNLADAAAKVVATLKK